MVKITVAYQCGATAARNGWERISPYTGVKAEVEWYAGYDSVRETK
jgi:hypothetical protein